MKLYSYYRSSSSWRVRLALELKQVAYELEAVDLLKDGGEHTRAAFLELNPMGQIPVLVFEHEGRTVQLAQSMAILEFLEERYPEPALLPKDAVLRAKARELAEIVNSGIQPLQNIRVLAALKAAGTDSQAWAKEHIARGLSALECAAAGVAGKYLVGDALSFADLCLVPQLYNARRFGVDLPGFPTLRRVEESCSVLEAFARAHPDRQPDAPP